MEGQQWGSNYSPERGEQSSRKPNYTIGGALEHQKEQNHRKLKFSKNAHFIHQIKRLGELFPMSTILVSLYCIGGALEHQKVQKSSKTEVPQKCTFNTSE